VGLFFIVVGDKNSSGGTVIAGSARHSIMGKGIARLGDKVDCPARYPGGRPHGVNPIIQGDNSYLIDGIPVALHGYKSACGCSLIGSMGAVRDPGSVVQLTNQSSAATEAPMTWAEIPKQTHKSKFSQFFQLKNSETDELFANTSYRIKLANGQEVEGVTDENGNTEKVFATDEQILSIEVI
jgi:uncharacterized Zn-binding protein involved in type VI secretion